jgi:transposase InsO family protein
VTAELRLGEGVRVSRKRVQRLMRHAGLSGLVARKRGRTTIRVPGVRVADDLVERRFGPDRPWVADLERHEAPWRRMGVRDRHRLAVAAAGLKLRAA